MLAQTAQLDATRALTLEGLAACAPALARPGRLATFQAGSCAHVQALLGFWCDGPDGERLLEIGWKRLKTVRAERPRWVALLQELQVPPVRLTVAGGAPAAREAVGAAFLEVAGVQAVALELSTSAAVPAGPALTAGAPPAPRRRGGRGGGVGDLAVAGCSGGAGQTDRARELDASSRRLVATALRQAVRLRDAAVIAELAGACAEELAPLPDGVGEQRFGLDLFHQRVTEEAIRQTGGNHTAAAALLAMDPQRLRRVMDGLERGRR